MKVAVSVVTFSKNKKLVDTLKQDFPDYQLNETGRRYEPSELIESLKDADAAIIGLDKIDEDVLKNCPNLKVISKHGIGTDKIDFDACQRYGVTVLKQNGTNQRSVSELTLGFMLDLMRGGYNASQELKNGYWNKYNNGGRNLTGKTIGVIGVGNIGKDLIRLIQPFNCTILGNDIRQDPEQHQFYVENKVKPTDKLKIYQEADIISLHLPLTDLTRNLIGERAFSIMNPSAYLINTCRGEIVNEQDLLTALKEKKIAGAALDVYQNEEKHDFYKTPFHEELFSLPNVIPTPHMGGTSLEASLALGKTAISNLKQYFDDKK